MRRRAILGIAAAALVSLAAGCGMLGGRMAGRMPAKEAMLCGQCGFVKGSDMCCKPGAEMCAKCGLAKGSPGCCKMQKGTDAALCPKCGQIAGSPECCKPGAAKCSMCGMAKGSPGCCMAAKGM
jgi:hypothetical protein